MGRPETKRWVSLLCLVLMWQDYVLAATIFPLKSESRTVQDSSLSWDHDDANAEDSDGKWTSLFSDDFISSSPGNDQETDKNDSNNGQKGSDIRNSLYGDSYSVYKSPGRSSWDDVIDEDVDLESEKAKSFTLPHLQSISALVKSLYGTRLSPGKVLKDTHITNWNNDFASASMGHLAIQHSRFDRETLPTSPTTTDTPSHDIHNHYNTDDAFVGSDDVKSHMQYSGRFSHANSIKNIRTSITTSQTPALINEEGENHSQHDTTVSDGKGSVSLHFKFPYQIPFSYVTGGNNEHASRKSGIRLLNTKEGRSSITTADPSSTFVNGDVRLQRKNRSRRYISELGVLDETKKARKEEMEIKEKQSNNAETLENLEENQQHKSSKNESFSVVGSKVGLDETAETNVRDNDTSRPPPSDNPLAALARITALLDGMLRELGQYSQKFSLRLIRMTEREDVEQMPDLMKDFEISPLKPIFFIAGGLKKLNNMKIESVASVVAANLTENVPVNETELANQSEHESNVTHHEEPTPEFDGTTIVPILRPSSTLPVESDDGEITTEIPDPEIDGLGDEEPGHDDETVDLPVFETEPINATTVSSSTHDPLPRHKRSIPGFDEYIFLPIPGRQARTENPYDDEEEFELFHDGDVTSSETLDGLRDDENPEHLLPLVVSTSSEIYPRTPILSNPARVIDQSHLQRNDEISLNDSKDITNRGSGENGKSPTVSHLPARAEELSSFSKEDIALVPSTPTTDLVGDGVVVPLSDSITTHERIREIEGSNGQHLQGEIIHEAKTSSVSIGKHRIVAHGKEKPLEEDKQVKANIVNGSPHVAAFSVVPDQVSLKAENEKPISSVVDKRNLNLVRETSTEEFDIGEPIASSAVVVPLLLENISVPAELLVQDAEDGEEKLVRPALPVQVFQVVEERSFHPNSATGDGKQNVAQNVPLLQNRDLMKDTREVSANQQLLNSELNDEKLISLDDRVSSSSVVAEENVVFVPPTHSSPTVEHVLLPNSHNITFTEEAIVVPFAVDGESNSLHLSPALPIRILEPSKADLDDKNVNNGYLETPNRAVEINKPLESNQDDPQDEIKAISSSMPQVSNKAQEYGTHIPVKTLLIKESMPTPNNAEKVSLTSEKHHVPVLEIQERTISSKPTTINNILVEDLSSQPNPIRVVSQQESHFTPNLYQNNNVVVESASTMPVASPQVAILDGESSATTEQTRNKQQSFNVVGENENQAELVGEQTKVAGVVMKKVGEAAKTGETITETEQLPLNQATFHAPTVLKGESPIIDHVSVRGAGTVDQQDTMVVQGKTDIIDTTVRNAETVSTADSSSNSDASTTKEMESIVAPIVSDNVEVRNPIETSFPPPVVDAGKENVDILSSNVGKENLNPTQPIISHEPSTAVLSTEVIVPLSESVGTDDAPKDDHVIVGSSTENVAALIPLVVSESSKESNVPIQDVTAPVVDSQDSQPLHLHQVGETGIQTIPDMLSVIDPSKIKHEDPQTTVVKIPPVADVPNAPVEVAEHDHKDIPLENISPVTLVLPDDQIPTDSITKVAPVEPEIPDVVKVAPVLETDIVKVTPIETPTRPSIDVNPVDVVMGEPSKPSLLEPRNPEVVKVDAIVHPEESDGVIKSSNLDVADFSLANNQELVHETTNNLPPANNAALHPDSIPVSGPEKTNPLLVDIPKPAVLPEPVELVDTIPKQSVISDHIGLVDTVLKPEVNPEPETVPKPEVKPDVIPEPVGLGDTVLKPEVIPETVGLGDTVLKPEVIPEAVGLGDTVQKPEIIHEPVGLADTVLKPEVMPEPVGLDDATSDTAAIPEPVGLVDTVPKPQIIPEPVGLTDAIPKPVELVDAILKPGVISEPVELVDAIPKPGVISEPVELVDAIPKPGVISEPVKLVEVISKPPVVTEPDIVDSPNIKLSVTPEPDRLGDLEVPNHVVDTISSPPLPSNVVNSDIVSSAQPVAAPMIPHAPFILPTVGGDENIISTLPQLDPDPSFGIKPIATQPHLQIPGLRPVPERPHPDYIGYMTQGVDANPLLFSPPTAPVIVHSPPVYSGYSPAAIIRKQQEMIQNYFHGMFYRQALD